MTRKNSFVVKGGILMSDFTKRLKEDEVFAKKLSGADAEARQEILKAEGYDVKGVREFMQQLHDDPDFEEKLSMLETMEEKMKFIVESGFYFTKEDLAAEQERLAEEEFDTLAGASCGALWEGHCGFTCEPETWKPEQTGCPGYFKCTWG